MGEPSGTGLQIGDRMYFIQRGAVRVYATLPNSQARCRCAPSPRLASPGGHVSDAERREYPQSEYPGVPLE